MGDLTPRQLSIAVGLVLTLLVAGIGIGKSLEASGRNTEEITTLRTSVGSLQTEFAFVRGVMVTNLDTIKKDITEIKERTENGN